MKPLDSPSPLIARVGIAVGLALLAGILLTVSIAVSALTARVPAAPAPAAQTAQPARATQAQASQAARGVTASPSRLAVASKGSPLTRIFDATGSPDPAEVVRRAWQQARAAGRYRFVSEMTQYFYQAPSLASAGSSPEREELHLEGDVDLPAQTLDLRLWQNAGSVLVEGTSVELRVESGVAYTRRLVGGSGSQTGGAGKWEETPDLSGNFAPGGDALGFLAGIKDITDCGSGITDSESQSAVGNPQSAIAGRAACYQFNLDGPAFARYLRDRMEEQLRERGKLPAGVTLDTAVEYRNAQGQGEVWIDEAGLPLRLTVHLVFPAARDGAHLEANIRSDFSGFPAPAAPPSFFDRPIDWTASALIPARHAGEWAAGGRLLFALAFGIGSLAVLLAGRRLRKVYAAAVVAVILSMVVVPLLHDQQIVAFAQEQQAQQAKLEQQQQQQVAARELAAEMAGPAWDPHRDPQTATPAQARDAAAMELLPQVTTTPTPAPTPDPDDCDASDTADRDGDGVNNYDECWRGLEWDVPDTDGDDLPDGVELNQLGTYPGEPDSDGDYITDTLEVQGYPYLSQTWYLNPLNFDTDGDTLLDSIECMTLTIQSKINTATVMSECDTDGDGTPNPFDLDSDDDGVVDAADLDPFAWTDRAGIHESGYDPAKLQPFNRDNPFALLIQGVEPGWPVLVDLYLRPQEAEHVTYSRQVLDRPWDVDGQIQHGRNTTLGDFSASTDEASRHGDMRMIPLLEVEMAGSSVPLGLVTPSATVTIGADTALTTTVTLTPTLANTGTLVDFTLAAGSAGLGLYAGTCAALGSQVGVTLTASASLPGKLVDLADGNHALVLATSGDSATACAELPNVVNGSYDDKMVDTSLLEPYGITVSEADATRNTDLLMYVPLNVMSDDTGGGKVAFLAHMLYWPGAANTWSTPQLARIVWAIQAVTDRCDDSGFPKTLEEYQDSNADYEEATQDEYSAAYRAHCARHRTADELRVVQTYDEDWYLTGLSVREDHGMWVAAAYENPGAPANATYPQPEQDLWQLSLGLNASFLNQRDCEVIGDPDSYLPEQGVCTDDGLRDLTVADRGNSNVGARFDAGVAASFTITDRWGIPADALQVQTVRYPHQDKMTDVATQLVPAILEELEGAYGQTLTPSILFAREEYYRSGGLEAGAWLAGMHVLSLDLGDHEVYPEQTLTAMNWEPFRYNASQDPVTHRVIGWESTPVATAIAQFEDQLRDYFAETNGEATQDQRDSNEGRLLVAESWLAGVLAGVANTADPCPDLADCKVSAPNSAAELAKGVVSVGKGVNAVVQVVVEEWQILNVRRWAELLVRVNYYDYQWKGVPTGEGDLVESVTKFLGRNSGSWSVYRQGMSDLRTIILIGGGVVAVGALVCMAILLAKGGDAAVAVVQTLGVIGATAGVVIALGKVLKAGMTGTLSPTLKNFSNAFHAIKGASSKVKGAMFLVGLGVNLALNVASFLIQWLAGGARASSAGATLAASLTVTLLYFFLFTFLGAIGSLIQAVIGLIDILVALICNVAGVTAEKNATAYKWACGGITGVLVNGLKALFYAGNVMVDMKDPDRLQTGNFDVRFDGPYGEGKAVMGNTAYYTMDITATLKLAPRPKDNPYVAANKDQWSLETLKLSTFKYEWTVDAGYTLANKLHLGDWKDLWEGTASPVEYTQTLPSDFGTYLDHTGRFTPRLYLAESYDVPFQECWAFDGCDIKDERKTTLFNFGENLPLDIDPPDVTGFRALASRGDGYALAWGGGGLDFPVLYDADNDGLPGTSDGDDSRADRDGDGLLDPYEVENGSNPATVDTDGDGLWDANEVRAGTNPRLQDTDGDGLRDKQELDGWEIVYAFKQGVAQRSWVRSDPLAPDIDGDTLMDSKEKVYGYNPNVPSNLNVLSLSSGLSESSGVSDGFVAPGQTLHYTATVKNELNNRWAEGLLQARPASGLTASKVTPREFVLRPQEITSTQASLVVAQGASGQYTLTQVAGALITDPEEPARGARVWLPFDDKAALLRDDSASLPPHDGSCVASGSTSPSADCTQDVLGQYAGGLKLAGTSYVEVPFDASETAYGLSLWFKTTCTDCGIFSVDAGRRGASGHDRHVYLSGGDIWTRVYGGSDQTTHTSGTSYADGRWHHMVHTFGGTEGGQKIYVDGLLKASGNKAASDFTWQDGINIGFSNDAAQDYFTGSIDDLRLYDHALTPAEVQQLFDQPVLRLGFDDQTTQFKDTSPFGVSVTCIGQQCPGRWAGVAGYGASFDGARWASTAQSAALSLDGGRLTLAAWLYPGSQNTTYDGWPQGVLGYHSGEEDGFPTLQRYGNKVRFGFGAVTAAGNAWKQFTSSADVLTPNAWNHVAVTYDQDTHTVTLYVNGRLRQVDSAAFSDVTGPVANPTPTIDIGRSGDLTSVKVSLPNVCDNGEYNWRNVQEPAEWCFTLNGNHLLRVNNVYAGWFTETETRSFRTNASVQMWEDDNDVCKLDSDANVASFKRSGIAYNPLPFSSNEVGNMANLDLWYNFEDSHQDWCGQVRFELSNTSIPFNGRLDDVRIYNQVLDAERVERLYREGQLALRLPLNDPPGTRNFAEASAVRTEVGCTSCPVAGLPGRMDQAASFDGSDYLVVSNGPANRIQATLSVAAWIRPDDLSSGVSTIAATAETHSPGGWSLLLDGNQVWFAFPGGTDKSGYWLGHGIPNGRWTHLVAVLGADGVVTFYVDGQLRYTDATSLPTPVPDYDDVLLIGAQQTSHNPSPTLMFLGMIDDLRVFNTALTAAEVKAVYDEAPVMHLRFDEAYGATGFADGARYGISGSCTKPACPATGDAVKGEVGLAAQFDGTDDLVTLSAHTLLDPAVWTVGAWVKPAGLKTTAQQLVSKGAGTAINYRLGIDPNSLAPRLETCGSYVTSTVPLVQDQWNQVLGTYDGSKLRIYVNGSESNSKAVTGSCTASAALYAGGDSTGNRLAGALDEVVLYANALRAEQVRDLFTYQNGWVEDRESQSIVVDNDAPVAEVLLSGNGPTYLPLNDTQIPIAATDPTSGIAGAALCVNGACGDPAPHCADPGQSSAWCPAFRPTAEGSYKLTAQATDLVGRTGAQSAYRTVQVDNTPPQVTLSATAGQRLDAIPDPAQAHGWRIHLSGAAADPNAGVGMPDDGVRVTVYSAGGGLAGPQRQVATFSGGAWSLDYPLTDSRPAGCYSVEVEASDALASLSGLDRSEIARHRTVITSTVGINASAPSVQLERAGLSTRTMISGTAAMGGVATSRPVSVKLTWTTGAGGAGAALSLVCSAPGSPTTYTPYSVPAGRLAAGETYSWGGEIQHDASCQVRIAAPAGSQAVLSGAISVCGSQVKTWSDDGAASQTVDFTAASTACASDNCGGVVSRAGVGRVDIAYTPLLPGSAFVEEAPLAGEVLHLPFEESAGSSGPFRDAAGGGRDATCSGNACPSPGQVGHSGSTLYLDGVDDYVQVPDSDAIDPAAGEDFTVAVWSKPDAIQPTATNSDSDIIEKWSQTGGYPYVIRYINQKGGADAGKIAVARYDGSHKPEIRSTKLINDRRFHHVAFVRSAGALKLFIDGVPDGETTDTTSGNTTNLSALFIGQRGNNINRFAGLIDDVRIFDRALTEDEIKALYAGSGPALVLPFEKQWAADGSEQEDASGWQHDAVLYTGSGDTANKAVSGQVGSYALQFDGVDDYAVIPDDDTIDFDPNHDFAVAAWVKPAPAQVWSSTVDNNVIEKWSGAGGYSYSIRYLNQTAGANAGKIAAGRWDGQHDPWLQSTTRIDDGRFHHVAFVKSGSTLAFYVDGTQHGQRTDTTTGATANTSPLYIGRRGGTALQGYFTGSVDDVRIYPHALSALEIANLYHAGWQQTALDPAGGEAVGTARWSTTLPDGLEGAYRLDLRSWDALATSPHVEMAPVAGTENRASPTWSTEIDTAAPRVTLCRSGTAGAYTYTALAQDFNLVEANFRSPCGVGVISTRDYFDSPWYVTTFAPGARRLVGLLAVCTLSSAAADETTYGADSAGNIGHSNGLSTDGDCSAFPQATAAALQAKAIDVASVLQVAEETAAAAGKPLRPSIAFVPKVFTTTHFYPPQSLEITGLVSGTHRITAVDVAVGDTAGPATLSEPARDWPFTRTWSYTWELPEGALPDGLAQSAVATATVQGKYEQRATIEQTLMLDVVPPAPVALTLTSDGKSVEPGATLRMAASELTLGWTVSSDGSGLGDYLARWSATSAETTTLSTRAHSPAGPLKDVYTAGEAERLQVDLGVQDQYGNQRWQECGAVYVDGPQTPDYIALSEYDGWMESGCSLLGADPRSTLRAATSYGRSTQQFYASWDRQALRLAWTGANWNGMGDLFVYLDTGPGGTQQVFTPNATPENGTVISLPEGLGADYLVWARSSSQATLLVWNGAWAEVKALDADEFRFDGSRRAGQTDLYLPFELLGLSPASSLGLLALASEEPAEGRSLELWATLPPANPVNSPKVSRWVGLVGGGPDFSLWRAYRWPALADGVCPSGASDSALEVTITANPAGASLSGLGNGLFWLPDPAPLAALPGDRDYGVLPALHPPLADGQPVEYTVHYRNPGGHAAKGVRLELSTLGQVRLLDTALELGDIPPGGEGQATFRAVADRSAGALPVAGVKALVYDAQHAPGGAALEWIWVAHRVDRGAPESGRVELGRRIGAYNLRLSGLATDEAGVQEVTVEVQGPNGAQTLTCPVARTLEGRWSCNWTPDSTLPDGSQVTVRLRATDVFGQQSAWSEGQTVVVDAAPPEVSFNAAGSGVRPGGIVSGRTPRLYGAASDASGVATVSVCVRNLVGSEGLAAGQECGAAELAGDSDRWTYMLPDLGALDYVSRTVTISAVDRVGNRTAEPLVLSGWVDNVAPVLAANQVVSEVVLGRTTTVLNGTVEDGSEAGGGPAVDVSVRVQPAQGEAFRADTVRDGATWRYDLTGARSGVYTLWIDADDAAGNRSSAGPFEVQVTCADAAVKAVALTAEPSPAGGQWLTLRATIRNTGPDGIPAGLPFVLYGPANLTVPVSPTGTLSDTLPAVEAMAPIGTVTTTLALAAGEQESLTLHWTTAAIGRVNLDVVGASDGVAYASEVALCSRPEPARFGVILQNVPLYGGWNLISPPVEPFNTDLATVQRPLAGSYRTILGYGEGLQVYDPEQPAQATLSTIQAGHGYWIRTQADAQPIPTGEEDGLPSPVATLHMAGQTVGEDQPLRLTTGWNLAGYLPQMSLPVTVALQNIDGGYASLLGFAGTAVSYYPGLEGNYNTLARLRPSAGYWISATKAMTLQYPSTVSMTLPITGTPTMSETLALLFRLALIQSAEQAAGVQPTYLWANLYGQVNLADGTPAPISTTLTALVNDMPCGATLVTEPGRFGLLACYGDDETTATVDGARPGNAITLLLNGAPVSLRPLNFNGQPVPAGQAVIWTAMGDRWEVVAGLAPGVDLAISKSVTPTVVTPGGAITYSLTYKNGGAGLAQDVVITDHMPPAITGAAFTSTGAAITRRQGSDAFEWDVADLAAGAGGVITITGVVDPAVADQTVITNTATISAPLEAWPQDNVTEVAVKVSMHPPAWTLWMPLITR